MLDHRETSYRAVLRNDTFRWLWLAILFSRIGGAIAQIAIPLLVYKLTGSSRLLGAIFVIETIPQVLLAPIAGMLADRVDRRKMMLRTAYVRVVAVAIIPFSDNVWQIAALAVVVAIAQSLSLPAELAALPETVPAHQLVPALSLTQVSTNAMRIIGPAVGASLIGFVGTAPAFWTEAICFLLAIASLSRLRLSHVQPQARERGSIICSARAEIADGLRVAWRTPIVRGVTAAECLWALIGAATTIAGLVYVKQTLDLGNRAELVYGLLAASLSAGAVAGALLASAVERRIGRPTLLTVGYLGPLLVIPVLVTPPVPVLLLCWFLFGLADAFAVIAMQAYLAESVDASMRGRVYATWHGVITVSWLICYGTVGWITDQIGPSWTMAIAGIIVGIGGPLALIATGAMADVRQLRPALVTEEGI